MASTRMRLINRFILRHRLLMLSILLMLLFLFFPFVHQYFRDYLPMLEFCFSLIMIFGIYITSDNRELLTFTILLALLTFTIIWFNLIIRSPQLLVISTLLEIIFFVLTTVVILNHVLSYKRVTADKIHGAVSGYLMIGIIWAMIYSLIENTAPGSFSFSHGLESLHLTQSDKSLYFANFMYYSFVTVTTLGYGDITPISNAAKVFSSLEAMVGQLYIAILISRLVGLHIGQQIHRQNS